MKNIHKTVIRRIIEKTPKQVSGIIAVTAAVLVTGGVAFAYGPERPTYTISNPADHVTFNSITNDPNHGDERNFVQIKEATDKSAGNWKDSLKVEDGKEYYVRIMAHNNAASNLNLVANNSRVMATVPTTTGTSVRIDGFVSANNASPQKVWDDAVMTSDKKFNIAYVAGSADYVNNVFTGGVALPDSIVTSTGALIGYDKMDGNIPGCFKYSGAAFFKVKVQGEKSPDFTVEKKVRLNGTTEWAKSINAAPGQKVDYQIGYKNTGTAAQYDVVAKDQLPAGIVYQNNSTTVKNAANPNGNGLLLTSNDLTNTATNGVNIGNYTAGSNANVRFTATLPTEDQLPACVNPLVNTATIYTANGNKSDTATVNVTKANCTPETPTTALPVTGPAEVIAGFIGIAAITIGVVYYYKSRRDLQEALHAAQSHPTHTKIDDIDDVDDLVK